MIVVVVEGIITEGMTKAVGAINRMNLEGQILPNSLAYEFAI